MSNLFEAMHEADILTKNENDLLKKFDIKKLVVEFESDDKGDIISPSRSMNSVTGCVNFKTHPILAVVYNPYITSSWCVMSMYYVTEEFDNKYTLSREMWRELTVTTK